MLDWTLKSFCRISYPVFILKNDSFPKSYISFSNVQVPTPYDIILTITEHPAGVRFKFDEFFCIQHKHHLNNFL